MESDNPCAVTVRVFSPSVKLNENEIAMRLSSILNLSDATADEISIVFVDDDQMREYNKSYTGRSETTDVLSFPCNEINPEGKFYLGDIIISIETAQRQAKEYNHSLQTELDILMTHAVLHILGFDHTKDNGQMETMQSEIVEQLHEKFGKED